MFIQAEAFTHNAHSLSFYGQESIETTLRLGKMNLIDARPRRRYQARQLPAQRPVPPPPRRLYHHQSPLQHPELERRQARRQRRPPQHRLPKRPGHQRQRQLHVDDALPLPPRRRRHRRLRHGQRRYDHQPDRRKARPYRPDRGRLCRLHRPTARQALPQHRHPLLPLVPQQKPHRQPTATALAATRSSSSTPANWVKCSTAASAS